LVKELCNTAHHSRQGSKAMASNRRQFLSSTAALGLAISASGDAVEERVIE